MGWPRLVHKDVTAALDAAEISLKLEKLGEATKFTPDAPFLERRKAWFLFVADEMMCQHFDYARLGAKVLPVGKSLTQEKFTLWKYLNSSTCTAVPLRVEHYKIPRAPIMGELYLVPSQQFFKLDTHRENGVKFIRERVKVIRPYTKVQLRKIPTLGYVREEERCLDEALSAWMYVGAPDYWNNRLDGGFEFKPVSRYIPNNPLIDPYYYFSVEEYDNTT